jgi:hypothetical protein
MCKFKRRRQRPRHELTSRPSNVSHEELWRFFNTTVPTSAQGATEPWRGPSSIFLISRSSCAFVNFSSVADLDRAVPFFNGLSLRPWDNRCPRMVCRIRNKDDDLRAGVGAQRGVGMHRSWVEQHKPERKETGVSPKSTLLELPEGGDRSNHDSSHKSSASFASTNSSFLAHHFPKRYFILKSLSTVRKKTKARRKEGSLMIVRPGRQCQRRNLEHPAPQPTDSW